MTLSRRSLLKGVLGLTATALILPKTVAEVAAEVEEDRSLFFKWAEAHEPKTYHFLDRTMLRDPNGWHFKVLSPTYTDGPFYEAEAWHDDGSTIFERVDMFALTPGRGDVPFFSGTPAQEAFFDKIQRFYTSGIINDNGTPGPTFDGYITHPPGTVTLSRGGDYA